MTDEEALARRAEVFGSMFVATAHLTRRADRALAPLGLSTRQWLLLGVLSRAFPGQTPSLSEAARRYGTSRQNVKQVALGLQARGFLRLVPDAADGRVTRLELTERVRLFDEPAMRARGVDLLAEALTGLTDAEIESLSGILRRWTASLSVIASENPE